MIKNSISIGTKVIVRVRDKLGSFNNAFSPTAEGSVVFISPSADFVVVDLGNYRTCYWCEDISPVTD